MRLGAWEGTPPLDAPSVFGGGNAAVAAPATDAQLQAAHDAAVAAEADHYGMTELAARTRGGGGAKKQRGSRFGRRRSLKRKSKRRKSTRRKSTRRKKKTSRRIKKRIR